MSEILKSPPIAVAQKLADDIIGDCGDMYAAVSFLNAVILELTTHLIQWQDMLRRKSMVPMPPLPADGDDLF